MGARHRTVLTAAVLAALLTACSGSAGSGTASPATTPATTAPAPATEAPATPQAVGTTVRGAPDGVTGEGTTVVAGDDARHVHVVTFGSSTCPVVPTDVTWDADAQVLRVALSDLDAYSAPCTMDLVPTTTVVDLPDDAPDAVGLTVDVDGRSVTVG